MFLVNEEFVTNLNTGKIDQKELLKDILPARPWHEEKLGRFLSQLTTQLKQREA